MREHTPVLIDEVLKIFSDSLSNASLDGSQDAKTMTIVDATLGGGGHAFALLEKFEKSFIVGFDQDKMAREIAENRLAPFSNRVKIVPENFSALCTVMEMPGLPDGTLSRGVNGVLFDLGVSNMQLTAPERGFSYQDDGPLDMRMDTSGGVPSAKELLETLDIRELTAIFKEYGEERHAFQIAKAIVRARERGEIMERTSDLVSLIRRTLPAPVQRKMGTHPARRVFQALRIEVNSELDALKLGLEGAREICKDGGVVMVISYHSLEDRIVKRTFLDWQKKEYGIVLTRRPIIPETEEIEVNRSSRSAKLRAFVISRVGGLES